MTTGQLLVIAAVLAALGALHWYAWRRLVRDLTTRCSVLRRAGTATFIAGPLLGLAAIRSDMPGIPFAWEGAVDWPGFLWLAIFLYLVLALAIGEAAYEATHHENPIKARQASEIGSTQRPCPSKRVKPRRHLTTLPRPRGRASLPHAVHIGRRRSSAQCFREPPAPGNVVTGDEPPALGDPRLHETAAGPSTSLTADVDLSSIGKTPGRRVWR